jgi:hypothetical protein
LADIVAEVVGKPCNGAFWLFGRCADPCVAAGSVESGGTEAITETRDATSATEHSRNAPSRPAWRWAADQLAEAAPVLGDGR